MYECQDRLSDNFVYLKIKLIGEVENGKLNCNILFFGRVALSSCHNSPFDQSCLVIRVSTGIGRESGQRVTLGSVSTRLLTAPDSGLPSNCRNPLRHERVSLAEYLYIRRGMGQ